MSEKKKSGSSNDLMVLICGCAILFGAQMIYDASEDLDGAAAILMMLSAIFACLAALILLLRVGLRGLPAALARKANAKQKNYSGRDDFSSEALDYFEQNPCETYYTDHSGRSWDNGFFDDFNDF